MLYSQGYPLNLYQEDFEETTIENDHYNNIDISFILEHTKHLIIPL